MGEDIGMSLTTNLSMDAAQDAITQALAVEGFGVLTEIDVQATLKAKIGIDRPAYKILGACNPVLANQALEHDEAIGLLLPCNVTLSDVGGATRVSIIDPLIMLASAGDSEEMSSLAADARERLSRALATLDH